MLNVIDIEMLGVAGGLMTSGMQRENELEKIRLAQLHGDLDAIVLCTQMAVLPVGIAPWAITFEGKKHLWNMISRLTKRVDDVILKDGMLVREVIHLAAKGRNQK